MFAPDLLRLAGALHPTPAVGGFPTAPALRWLTENEPFERDWYAAPIGWVGTDGGELAVGIRSALISGSSAVVYAGCGIVEGSNPAGRVRGNLRQDAPDARGSRASTTMRWRRDERGDGHGGGAG